MVALALLPILAILVLMVAFRWSAARAGTAGWLLALVLANRLFGAGPLLLLYSQLRALALAFFVLYIIWMALLLYHVVSQADALATIAQGVGRITGQPHHQLLLLAWVFASTVQGVTGFGVPTAVVAPMLVGLGFDPMLSVVTTTIGHTWAVSFGSVASSFYALIAVSGVPGEELALPAALLLGMLCLACGGAVAWIHGRGAGLWRSLPLVGAVGLLMAAVQLVLAWQGVWSLAAFGAGLAGLVGAALWLRREWRSGPPLRQILLAGSAYLYLLVIVMAAELVGPLNALLDSVRITVELPASQTALGWTNPPGTTRPISLFGHPGALLVYSSLLGYLTYQRAGRYRRGSGGEILVRTAVGSRTATVGILTMVGMAMMMEMSGMTFALAQALSGLAGGGLALVAPAIGGLGAFMTGSNTNSNVVFGPLQRDGALLAGLSVPWILAAQNAGGAIGSMLAPAKIIVGASTVQLAGREGEVLRRTLGWGVGFLAAAGLLAWALSSYR